MNISKIAGVIVVALFLAGCGSSPPDPLEKLRKELDRYSEYAVILENMEESGWGFFSEYRHLYHIITVEKGEDENNPFVKEQISSWYPVSKHLYEKYKPCLGMTILSKNKDGEIDTTPQPPTYQFVGDPRFGRWTTDDSGNKVWEWLGKYYVISSLVGTVTDLLRSPYRIGYDDWMEYRTSMSKRKPYFGKKDETGKTIYGTSGRWTEKKYPSFFERQRARMEAKKTSFDQRVSDNLGKTRTSTFRTRTSSSSFGGRAGGGK